MYAIRSYYADSFAKLPSANAPISGAASGKISAIIIITIKGKINFSNLWTFLVLFITILLSSTVVKAFIIGGWITGTKAIYEYAATAIAPNSSGANAEAIKIDVGPSAPPIILIRNNFV